MEIVTDEQNIVNTRLWSGFIRVARKALFAWLRASDPAVQVWAFVGWCPAWRWTFAELPEPECDRSDYVGV